MKRWEIYLDIIMELLVILAGALLLIFVLPKAIVFLWPFVAGWIISMMAHPVIEYLEKKVKLLYLLLKDHSLSHDLMTDIWCILYKSDDLQCDTSDCKIKNHYDSCDNCRD